MSDHITLVSGLPRSGTSMMMKMLQAGGLPLLTDEIRAADEDNPKGYFEFEQVKKLKEDQAWLEDARGKVVKVISQLLFDLPPTYHYKVIFMRRRIEEVLSSQREMLKRRGTFDADVKDDMLRTTFLQHLDRVGEWLRQQSHIDVLYLSYNRMLESADEHVDRVNAFLGGELDTEAMRGVVDRNLYRQRTGD
jgi:hypothetical protein